MAENELDPARSTQQFRAFTEQNRPEPATPPGIPLGTIGAVAAVGALIAIAVLALVLVMS
ncbi:hypothetical protein LO762_25625 [Actinocorallia sp. API 0066]|uniref:hypothetical protein n=1 Tax=Actinocorallia sp. API 0066 TaxID=2896846 RepID=UPI001E54CB58|nr:hypothetical protein [Actinocorallia sp. API 0066]MCD0452539.1 hypothetical protein [Actinocorallia sp. API 0066]